MTDTDGATASAADVDWGPMDQQLHTELMKKTENSEKMYRQMQVSCYVQQHMHTPTHVHTYILIHMYTSLVPRLSPLRRTWERGYTYIKSQPSN